MEQEVDIFLSKKKISKILSLEIVGVEYLYCIVKRIKNNFDQSVAWAKEVKVPKFFVINLEAVILA